MKAAITTKNGEDNNYAYVFSYRRQVNIHTDDEKDIPEEFKIKYEVTSSTVFVTMDTAKYFLCHKEGHLAKDCKTFSAYNNRLNMKINQHKNEENNNKKENTNLSNESEKDEISILNTTVNDKTDENNKRKRDLESVTSGGSEFKSPNKIRTKNLDTESEYETDSSQISDDKKGIKSLDEQISPDKRNS